MTHRRARRLLYALPDGLLSARAELRVRQHVRGCGDCRRTMLALEASEALLRRLPASLVPLDASPEADARLAGLARWGEGRGDARAVATAPARRRAPWQLPAVGAATAAACLAAVLLVGGGSRIAPHATTEDSEAFNFVVTSSLQPGRAEGHRPSAVARIASWDLGAAPIAQRSDHYYLPVGVR
jgi:hypothetical protein